MNNVNQLFGTQVDESALILNLSKEFCRAVNLNPFSDLLECRKIENLGESIIVELEIEIPQKCKNDIREKEQVGVIFYSDENRIPEVYALRNDFPSVPHINLKNFEFPRCLCLYEETYEELKLRWSSFAFLERIREWMRLTAKGKLHAEDQPLEPLLFFTNSFLILPDDILRLGTEFLIGQEIISNGCTTIVTKRLGTIEQIYTNKNYFVIPLIGSPQTHGIISHIPKNFADLYEFFEKCNIDLKTVLRLGLRKLKENNHASLFESKLILVLIIPQKRSSISDIEALEERAFLTDVSLKEIGIKLGVWNISDGNIGLNVPIDETQSGNEIDVQVLNSYSNFTPRLALHLNNVQKEFGSINILCIGLGTLGSQIYNTLLRQGIGIWKLQDDDIVLPHNLARHILENQDIGYHKANILAQFGNNLFPENSIAEPIIINVLKHSEVENKILQQKLTEADVVLDFSASIPVSRSLSNDFSGEARRISAFFTPNGKDSVLIIEDANRMHKLDMLENQYYRGLIHNNELQNHLAQPREKIRYGHSCRDVSTILPFDLTVQHAGVISTEIKNSLIENNSSISVWRCMDGGIKKYSLPIYKETRLKYGDWTLVFDEYLIQKIYSERENKLPNETGGALIGSYDHQRKIIYILDSISSPEDSVEWPTVYIRGIKGLKSKIENVEKISDHMLTYIGEWHSHPKGCLPKPSPDDIKAFLWLAEVLDESGMLSLMLIVGEGYKFYLGEII